MKVYFENTYGMILIDNLYNAHLGQLVQIYVQNYEIFISEQGCPDFMPRTILMGKPYGLATWLSMPKSPFSLPTSTFS